MKKISFDTKKGKHSFQEIDERLEKIIINSEQIKVGIKNAASWINDNYKNNEPVLVAILKGAFPFYGQLITEIKVDVVLDFMVVSSFKGGTYAKNKPEIVTDLITNIKGRDLILVDDVVDTARTMNQVINLLKERGAKSVKIVTLVDKPNSRKVPLKVDFACFNLGSEFIVGFGLDYEERLRNLPYIGILKKEIYQSTK